MISFLYIIVNKYFLINVTLDREWNTTCNLSNTKHFVIHSPLRSSRRLLPRVMPLSKPGNTPYCESIICFLFLFKGWGQSLCSVKLLVACLRQLGIGWGCDSATDQPRHSIGCPGWLKVKFPAHFFDRSFQIIFLFLVLDGYGQFEYWPWV